MLNPRVFDEAMEPYGGRLDRVAIGSSVARLFDLQCTRARAFLSSVHNVLPKLPPIHFDFVNDFVLNARACLFKGEYCIGINSAVIVLLSLLFGHLLSDRRILPKVGNPDEERLTAPRLPFLDFDALKVMQAGGQPVLPNDNVRVGYCRLLLEMAFDFLVSHEVAHIVNGHLAWMKSIDESRFLSEFEQRKNGATASIKRQALEMDADSAGACDGMRTILRKTANLHSVGPPWRQFYASPETAFFAWSFAVHSLFRIFGDEPFLGLDLKNAIYPPIRLRQFLTAVTADEYVTQRSERADLPEIFRREHIKAVIEAEQAFALVTGEAVAITGYQQALSLEATDHFNQLLQCWKNDMRPALLPFAYGRLPD